MPATRDSFPVRSVPCCRFLARPPVFSTRCSALLLRQGELERHLNELFDWTAIEFGGIEAHPWDRVAHGDGEEIVRGLQDLEGRRVGHSVLVDDELREDLSFHF